jgi:uncharacterized RDD family membrane protein YckC
MSSHVAGRPDPIPTAGALPPPHPNGDGRGIFGRVTDRVTGRVVDTIHPDIILDHVDVNAIVERIDVNSVVERIDVDALVERLDVTALMDRIDLERLLARVDLESVVRRSGIPEIVAESTNKMAGSALDVGRRQLVGLDAVVERIVDRLFRRSRTPASSRPRLLREEDGSNPRSVTGKYAGAVSRAAAATIDVIVVMGAYTVAYAGLQLLMDAFFDATPDGRWWGLVSAAALSVWGFLYYFVSLAVAGRTVGKSLAGLRVLSSTGTPLSILKAFVRTVASPLSALFFGLGYLPIVLQREHRALHDFIAGTAVVYDWGDRTAQLPGPLSDFLSRQGS